MLQLGEKSRREAPRAREAGKTDAVLGLTHQEKSNNTAAQRPERNCGEKFHEKKGWINEAPGEKFEIMPGHKNALLPFKKQVSHPCRYVIFLARSQENIIPIISKGIDYIKHKL